MLISGASRGIGLAAAKRFLEEGSRVFLCGLDADEVNEAVGSLTALGEVSGITCDVSREEDVRRLVDEAAHALGRIDVLINNAGVAWKDPFLDMSLEHWDRTLAVNLRGMFMVAQAVARKMVEDGKGGAIVNMASTNALGGEEEFAHYNASKGGVLQLTRTMAVELGGRGIRVNSVCPGFIDTPIHRPLTTEEAMQAYERSKIPLRRRGRADEVAAAYAFLASDEASFINGEALVVDGGQTAVM